MDKVDFKTCYNTVMCEGQCVYNLFFKFNFCCIKTFYLILLTFEGPVYCDYDYRIGEHEVTILQNGHHEISCFLFVKTLE